MKTLVVTAGLFIVLCGAGGAYLANSGPNHEYDLKYVLPIDTRSMPKPTHALGVEGQGASTDGNLTAQADPVVVRDAIQHKPFKFDEKKPLTPELRASE